MIYKYLIPNETQNSKGTKEFLTLMGLANRLIQIETINIMKAITKLSKYQVIPRKGHLDRAKRILGYHKKVI
jgi:hypothetical protein